jgi:2-hydroxy-3-oxopropionate reductase
MLDAPVSGGQVGAQNASLSIMVAGSTEIFEKIKPYFEIMGKNIVLIGGNGDGQTCKVANQIIVALNIEAVAEALLFAAKAGADPAKVRQALMGGFAASRVLEVHGERILKKNFTPGFRAGLYNKDMGIAMETARTHQVPVPVSAVVAQLVGAVVAAGRADDDYSGLARVLFDMAGLGE